jgi:hypothetical protein
VAFLPRTKAHPLLEHRILHLALCPISGGQYRKSTLDVPEDELESEVDENITDIADETFLDESQ